MRDSGGDSKAGRTNTLQIDNLATDHVVILECGKIVRTITVDCAMSARLLAVTLDLFPATLVTCTANAAPLLHG